MKHILLFLTFLGTCAAGQTLTADGIAPVTTIVDFSQKEIFDKTKSFVADYLSNENIQITKEIPGESITLLGQANHKACFLNQLMGSKTCFNLIFTLQITAQDNQYIFDVTQLKAESDRYPEADYSNWFDANANPIDSQMSCINGTSEYFQSINKDIKQYIEEGEYW